MIPKDLEILDNFLAHSFAAPGFRVVLHSPVAEQVDCFNRYFDNVQVVTIEDWNIMNQTDLSGDLIYFGMVFHYIADPELALRNIMERFTHVLIQDLIYRDRSGSGIEFCGDGDCQRYSYRQDRARVGGYDLSYIQPIFYQSYIDDETDSKHFIMMI